MRRWPRGRPVQAFRLGGDSGLSDTMLGRWTSYWLGLFRRAHNESLPRDFKDYAATVSAMVQVPPPKCRPVQIADRI